MKYFFKQVVTHEQSISGAWYARVLCVKEDGNEECFFIKTGFGDKPVSKRLNEVVLKEIESKESEWNIDHAGVPITKREIIAKLGFFKRTKLMLAKAKDKLWRFIT